MTSLSSSMRQIVWQLIWFAVTMRAYAIDSRSNPMILKGMRAKSPLVLLPKLYGYSSRAEVYEKAVDACPGSFSATYKSDVFLGEVLVPYPDRKNPVWNQTEHFLWRKVS